MEREVFLVCIGRLREGGDDRKQMGTLSATFTPRGKLHWSYEQFGKDKDGKQFKPNTELIHAATWENPFLPPEFFAAVSQQYTTEYARQELGGEFLDPLGVLCQRGWFKIVPKEAVPELVVCVRSWDMAATPDDDKKAQDPDWTVGTLMGKAKNNDRYILDVRRDRLSPGQCETRITSTAIVDDETIGDVKITMEREPGAAGKAVIDTYRRLLAGYSFEPDKKREDKMERAVPFAAFAEHGHVYLVKADWNDSWLDEICSFPMAPHDDRMDSASQAHFKLRHGAGHGPSHFPIEKSKKERTSSKSTGNAKLARRLKSHTGSSGLYGRYRRSAYPLGRRRVF